MVDGQRSENPSRHSGCRCIALNMAVAVVFGRQQVAQPRIMAFFQKRIAHDAGKLAGDEDPESPPWRRVVLTSGFMDPKVHPSSDELEAYSRRSASDPDLDKVEGTC